MKTPTSPDDLPEVTRVIIDSVHDARHEMDSAKFALVSRIVQLGDAMTKQEIAVSGTGPAHRASKTPAQVNWQALYEERRVCLIAARYEVGMTTEELAKLIGVSKAAVHKMTANYGK
jgi:DNA-directed RNA polymerase specialized sigma24 family protein